MKVPLFDMAAELAAVRADIDRAIARVLDRGVFIGGDEVASFERMIAETCGKTRAVGTSSGSDALHAIFMALGIGPGDDVITTPLTFFATAGSAARLGARIVFADVDDATLTLDPDRAASASSTKTRAIVPVDLFGFPAESPAVRCPVVVDAAHSVGARLRGHIAALSFFPTKNLGALGDAGAVVCDDDDLADRITLLRTHGARPKYHHLAVGGNFRLDTLQAAILSAKLPHLPNWIAKRRHHAARYRLAFADARVPDELRLPAHHPAHTYHQFVIRAPRRDELRQHLTAAGIGTEIYYPSPLHLQPCFAELGYKPGSLPLAERACREVLALPIHPALPEAAIDHVVEAISVFYAL